MPADDPIPTPPRTTLATPTHHIKIFLKSLAISLHGIIKVMNRLLGKKETAHGPRTLCHYRDTGLLRCGIQARFQPRT